MATTLDENDIEKLFSGAPQFYCRAESHFPGAPHPSVAFPFDEEVEIRDLSDHVQIEDKAWSGVTAWPHLTRDLNHDAAARKSAESRTKAHFHVRCRERPNMLSMQGLEKGTMGFQAALELPVGDSLEEEQFGFESVGTKAKAIIDARARMLAHSGWLRRLPEPEIMHRLERNGEIYRNNDMRKRPSVETYNDLFHSFMRPCATPLDKQDHYSLINQINALVKCLATANVWIDLSRVEWRIRLGQVLWGQSGGDELDDATEIQDAASASERAEEKYWLLMQVLVSTELLIRLDAITEGEANGVEYFRPVDGLYFERQANQSVKWSILLARSWLDNIELVKEEAGPGEQADPVKQNGGWLASLVSKMSLKHSDESLKPGYHYTIKGRNGHRQVDGLTHFARKIHWPGIDAYESRISVNAENTGDLTPTTLSTPGTLHSVATTGSSYFGAWDVTSHHGQHHHAQKVQAQRRKMAAALHASGWLSKSYIFALMLPGEALSHFLMSTLLENDQEAMGTLGSFANLCGGFVYRGKSFWSTSCIVGRVLAAGVGAAECMGWISTDILPDSTSDGWLNIEAEDVPDDLQRLGKKARIWGKKRIERDSYILGDGDESNLEPGDFTMPHENNYEQRPAAAAIELRSFKLLRSVEAVHPSPLSEFTGTPLTESTAAPDLPSYPAKLIFSVTIGGARSEDFTFPLTYDISFVTAHPCSPSRKVRFVKSPSSPTIQQIDVSGKNMLGSTSRSVYRAGHPLHKSYHYSVVHISELIKKRGHPLIDLLGPSPHKNPKANDNRVLVIDCITNYAEPPPPSPVLTRVESGGSASLPSFERRGSLPDKMHLECRRRQFGSDMEILVRALCSQMGWNALISRRKRGCLACAIREACALGWRVIVRVE
ncbi:uncharacterized protein F5Z01DRAFT_427349 [Emericellopsis atlantica]|uniref:Helicase-like protein n=1 Tax=Emericellopsis atlantica TaxID=2614577 RepID=A0A9P8CK85_9HYPO|nr:uncharacterized protein F5Z01DRAFT_427349 [Emericellopsis atlantica]KAG9250093.1 hypothetical protein F5Z01DRAFT_427349 [Emericellopsis atlantica]